MKHFKLQTHYRRILADTLTPVSVYLKIRDRFPNSILLESSDYHTSENSFSYICCNPLATISVQKETLICQYPDGSTTEKAISEACSITEEITSFINQFESNGPNLKFAYNGLFGFTGYDAVRYFEKTAIAKKEETLHLPDLYYAVYQNIIAIDHFKNEAYLFCHAIDATNNVDEIEHLLHVKNFTSFTFSKIDEAVSNLTDAEFVAQIQKAKAHCHRGDVFQLVLSRRFSQKFKGDEFNVYRALRSINPSPYLFFFDYGDFKIFGSSPEAHLVVTNNTAEIHPIAGTFKRTGNDEEDAKLATELANDTKETSEHVMLVDLARNDLSRNCTEVVVEKFKEIQFFSHVIHLVSKVTGRLKPNTSTLQIMAGTFPAGTLTGAPKHKAMQLIEKIEVSNRKVYGGAIGFIDFNGNFNHAILIRSFVSQNHQLHYQAGAGIVANSSEELEKQEVYNKLNALNQALVFAEQLK